MTASDATSPDALSREESLRLAFEASEVFTPAVPIDQTDLFAGRTRQVAQIIDAVGQRGQHVVMYGERGVGKTSLAKTLSALLRNFGKSVAAPLVTCDGTDTFSSLWRKMFAELYTSKEVQGAGFATPPVKLNIALAEQLPDAATPDDIRRILAPLGYGLSIVLIFDEFDRLSDSSLKRLMAETIKVLSDHAVRVTIVLVGVADNIDELLGEHESVGRNIVQIQMPRMQPSQLEQILRKGEQRLGVSFTGDTVATITSLSQGFPSYTHLLGLHSVKEAATDGTRIIESAHAERAIAKAVELADHSIRDAYRKGINSPRKYNLYADVILACALAERDEFGFFQAATIRDPFRKITGKPYEIASFIQHLANLTEKSRGPVLRRSGEKRRYKFRFDNPLMEPFVRMRSRAPKSPISRRGS